MITRLGLTRRFFHTADPSSSGENRELITDVQDLEQNQSDFRYEVTMVRISALGWASNLRNLPEMNFSQLYDYALFQENTPHRVERNALQEVPQKLFRMA